MGFAGRSGHKGMETKRVFSVVAAVSAIFALEAAAAAAGPAVPGADGAERVNVAARTDYAFGESAENMPGELDWGVAKYSFTYYPKPGTKPGPDSLWARQTFTVPDDWEKDRLRLYFATLDSDIIVFVNGERAAEVQMPRGWADITGLARAGDNELVYFMSRTYASMSRNIKTDPIRRAGSWKPPKGRPMGVGKGGIWLERTTRPFGLDDAWVTTSFRRREAVVHADVLADHDGEATLSLVAERDGKEAFRAEGVVALRKGFNEVAVTNAWPDPELWDTDDGRLYDATVSLKGAGGANCGERRFRFGFREIWTEGREIILNGHPVHYRTEITWFGLNRDTLPLFRALGRNCIYEQPHRNHWWGAFGTHPFFDEKLLDLCDEEGIAVFLPTVPAGLMGSVYRDPLFRRDYERETRLHMRLYRRHPCIMGWAISMNTFNPKDAIHPSTLGRRSDYSNGQAKCLEECMGMVKEVDPTRLVYGHADGNLCDIATANCYPNWTPVQEVADYPENWMKSGDMPYFAVEYDAIYCGSFYRDNHELVLTEYGAIYYGEDAYRRETDYQLEHTIENGLGNRFHGNIVSWKGVNSEFVANCPLYFDLREEYVRATDRYWRLAGVQMWEYFHGANYGHKGKNIPEGFRERMTEIHGSWMQPFLCFIAGGDADGDRTHVYFPGETVSKRFGSCFDGKGGPLEVECRWSVVDASGKPTGIGGKEKWSLPNGGIRRVGFSFKAPDASARADYRIVMDAKASNGAEQHDEFAFTVMPKTEPPALGRRVVLFDPAGRSSWAAALAPGAVVATNAAALPSLDPQRDILVVGREALEVGGFVPWTEELVADGLAVLVLEQKPEVLETFGFRCDDVCARQSFRTEAAGGIMDGLEDSDVGYWRGTPDLLPEYRRERPQRYQAHPRGSSRHAISSTLVEIPVQVGFVPLMQYEFDLDYSPLLRWNRGKGAIVFSTYDFTGRADGTDPAATRLAANVLSYMSRLRSDAGRRVMVNRGAPSPDTDAFLAAGGSVLNLAFDRDALAARGLSGVTQDVRRATFDGVLRSFAPANLSRWRDVLHATRLEDASAGSEGLFLLRKGSGGRGDEMFLQVGPSLLEDRYLDAEGVPEAEVEINRYRRKAMRRSIERLRQLECRARTFLGEESPPEVAAALCSLAKAPGFAFIESWHVLGPFADDADASLMSAVIPGEENAIAGDTNPNTLYGPDGLDFRKVAEAGKDGYVDLAKTFGETDTSSIGFAVAEYDAPEARDALLKLGMDYFSRTWLNGKEVLDNRKGFGTRCAPGTATVKVHLEKGRNVFTHKIKSGSAGYGFYCELSEPGYDTDAGNGDGKPKSRTDLLYGTGLKQSPPYSYHYW